MIQSEAVSAVPTPAVDLRDPATREAHAAPAEDAVASLADAWRTSAGDLNEEMLEYHRSRHRDGRWRDTYRPRHA